MDKWTAELSANGCEYVKEITLLCYHIYQYISNLESNGERRKYVWLSCHVIVGFMAIDLLLISSLEFSLIMQAVVITEVLVLDYRMKPAVQREPTGSSLVQIGTRD